MHVPEVDISPYVTSASAAARHTVAEQMHRACSEIGFVQVHGHGIPRAEIDELASAMDRFFDLSPAEKGRYRVEGANRGYSPPKSEALSLSLGVAPYGGKADFFEAFNVGVEAVSFPDLDLSEDDYGRNLWPAVEGFEAAVSRYMQSASAVATVLTDVLADALELPAGFFDRLTDHSVDVLRMNNYALPGGTEVGQDELFGMGPHTDFGLVTVLWADQEKGLEVLGPDQCWHDVMPEEGALLVNLGDLMARLTNDRFSSTLHQVRPPLVGGTVRRRRSAAFFRDGNADAVVGTVPSCVAPGSRPRYVGAVTVKEHLAAKLAGSRGGTRNTRAGSEADRVRSAVPAGPS